MLNVNMTKKAFADERNTPRLRITFNGTQTISQDDIMSAKLTEMLADNNITMGSTFSQSFEIVMRMPETAIPLTSSYFTAETSFDGMLWADLGTFYVSSTSTNGEQITVTASDRMASLTDDYVPSVPLTAAQVLTDICSKYSLATEGINMPDVALTEAYEGTVRDYIGWLAGLCGENARFNRYGKLTFDWFSQISNIYGDATLDHKVDAQDVAYINNNLLGSASTEEAEAILGRMIVGKSYIAAEIKDFVRAPLSDVNEDGIVDSKDMAEIQAYIDGTPYDPTNVGKEGEYVQLLDETRIERNGFTLTARDTCKIYALISGTDDNPIESGTGRAISFYNPLMTQEVLDGIVTNKLPIEYTSAEMSYRGCPTWEVGDIIRVEADKNYNVPIMYHELSFSSKLEGSIKSYALSDEEESTLGVLPDVKTVERQLPEIKQVIADINSTLLSGDKGYMVLDEEVIDGVKRLSGFKIMDTPAVSSITKGWIANKDGLGWSSDGFKTISKLGLDMANGKIYADQIAAGSIITNSFQIGSDGTGMTFDGLTGKITFGPSVEMGGRIHIDTDDDSDSLITINYNADGIKRYTEMSAHFLESYDSSIGSRATVSGYVMVDDWDPDKKTVTKTSTLKYDGLTTSHVAADSINTWTLTLNGEDLGNKLSEFVTETYVSSNYAAISHGHSGSDIDGGYPSVESIYLTNPGTASSVAVYRSTNSGILGIPSSSRRYKNSIADVTEESLKPERLYDLPVRQFKWNDGHFGEEEKYDYNTVNIGFIAEEVAEIYPFAAVAMNEKIETWEARNLLPPMLALIQQQKKEIDALKEKVEALS